MFFTGKRRNEQNLPDPREKRGRAGSFAIRQAAGLPLRPIVPADQDGRQESELISLYRQTQTVYKNLPDPREKTRVGRLLCNQAGRRVALATQCSCRPGRPVRNRSVFSYRDNITETRKICKLFVCEKRCYKKPLRRERTTTYHVIAAAMSIPFHAPGSRRRGGSY
jgi:hypothetical protein